VLDAVQEIRREQRGLDHAAEGIVVRGPVRLVARVQSDQLRNFLSLNGATPSLWQEGSERGRDTCLFARGDVAGDERRPLSGRQRLGDYLLDRVEIVAKRGVRNAERRGYVVEPIGRVVGGTVIGQLQAGLEQVVDSVVEFRDVQTPHHDSAGTTWRQVAQVDRSAIA
jgi:hypothetical protein